MFLIFPWSNTHTHTQDLPCFCLKYVFTDQVVLRRGGGGGWGVIPRGGFIYSNCRRRCRSQLRCRRRPESTWDYRTRGKGRGQESKTDTSRLIYDTPIFFFFLHWSTLLSRHAVWTHTWAHFSSVFDKTKTILGRDTRSPFLPNSYFFSLRLRRHVGRFLDQ